jgi:hypothetical protein
VIAGPVFYRRPFFFGPALFIGLMFALIFGCCMALSLMRFAVR